MTVIDQIDTTASIIRRHTGEAPVLVDAIARDLSIPVFFDHRLPNTVSGKIVRDRKYGGASGFAIFVNGNHPPRRQRFTLAHEIAHYVLHRDLIENELVDNEMYRSGAVSDWYERQADRFAAEMLMPADLVRRHYRADKSIPSLSEAFDVSYDAAKYRLKELKLGA